VGPALVEVPVELEEEVDRGDPGAPLRVVLPVLQALGEPRVHRAQRAAMGRMGNPAWFR